MADVQDDDQWLYGDEKNENKEDGEESDKADESREKPDAENEKDKETPMEEGGEGGKSGGEEGDKGKEGEEAPTDKDKDKEDEKEEGEKGDDDDSSDDDDLTITIGAIKTQPDIIQGPTAPHPARFQPKAAPTTGLKDDDFNSAGKINGVSVTEFNLSDLEDKPWRKPGADISDYFNYGFNEETWFKYCERQKRMRINESGAGLGGLGITVTKPFGNSSSIPVTIVNDNSKYGTPASRLNFKAGPPPRNKGMGQIDVIGTANKPSTIQVMTADRREYSNKVMNSPLPPMMGLPPQLGYNDMEFGGNPYGETYYPEVPFYGENTFDTPPPWGPGGPPPPPPVGQNTWEGAGPPPPILPPVSSGSSYFNEEPISAPPPPPEPEEERHRSRRSHRSRSRSPSRHRHSSSRHRSRSRSPSHRHKRKKSKRDRDAD